MKLKTMATVGIINFEYRFNDKKKTKTVLSYKISS